MIVLGAASPEEYELYAAYKLGTFLNVFFLFGLLYCCSYRYWCNCNLLLLFMSDCLCLYWFVLYLDLMLSGPEMVKDLLDWGENRNDKHKKIEIHCMLDTGMTRIGFQVNDCMETIYELAKENNGLKFVGLCTHMAEFSQYLKYSLFITFYVNMI